MGLLEELKDFKNGDYGKLNPATHFDLPMFVMFGFALGAFIYGFFYALLASLWGESGVVFSVKYFVVGLKYLGVGLAIVALTMAYWWVGPRRKGAVIWQLNVAGIALMIVVAISSLCNFWYDVF